MTATTRNTLQAQGLLDRIVAQAVGTRWSAPQGDSIRPLLPYEFDPLPREPVDSDESQDSPAPGSRRREQGSRPSVATDTAEPVFQEPAVASVETARKSAITGPAQITPRSRDHERVPDPEPHVSSIRTAVRIDRRPTLEAQDPVDANEQQTAPRRDSDPGTDSNAPRFSHSIRSDGDMAGTPGDSGRRLRPALAQTEESNAPPIHGRAAQGIMRVARAAQAQPAATIEIHIGRVEVRAQIPASAPKSASSRPADQSPDPLNAHLKARTRGARS